MARSTLVATTEHMVGVANNSLAYLQGTVEQALVVVASQVAATGTAQLWDAIAASQLRPCGAATPRPLSAQDTTFPTSLPMGEMPTLQEAPEAGFP